MPNDIREKFLARLHALRNMVVADVQLSKGEKLTYLGEKEGGKEEKKVEESKTSQENG